MPSRNPENLHHIHKTGTINKLLGDPEREAKSELQLRNTGRVLFLEKGMEAHCTSSNASSLHREHACDMLSARAAAQWGKLQKDGFFSPPLGTPVRFTSKKMCD